MKIIHAVSSAPFKVKIGRDARSRCGKIACVETVGVGALTMTDAAGNQFLGTTHAEVVTCKKCVNLITTGTINGKPSRAAFAAQQRAMDKSRRSARAVRGA